MSNCARLYNVALSKNATPPNDFPFQFQLSGDHVWSAIVQISLIEDLALYDGILTVSHGGDHKDRFTAAIKACNLRVRLYGQEELCHYCGKCTTLHSDNNGTLIQKFSVAVTDGVTGAIHVVQSTIATSLCSTTVTVSVNSTSPLRTSVQLLDVNMLLFLLVRLVNLQAIRQLKKHILFVGSPVFNF
jgi:hypothetical protein